MKGADNPEKLPDGPVYNASSDDMDDLPRLVRRLGNATNKYGAVCVVPPPNWGPPYNLAAEARNVRETEQILPHPPFAKAVKRGTSTTTTEDTRQNEVGKLKEDVRFESKEVLLKSFKKRAEHCEKKILKGFKLFPPPADLEWEAWDLVSMEYDAAFWTCVENGMAGRAVKLYYAADLVKDEMVQKEDRRDKVKKRKVISLVDDGDETVEEEIIEFLPEPVKWWSGNVNQGGSLRHMEDIPGINVSMFYLGSLFTFFGLHIEDEALASISYNHTGAPKIWYVYPPNHKKSVDQYGDRHLFDSEYINTMAGGAGQVYLSKSTLFNPAQVCKVDKSIRVYRFVQKAGQFVVTAPLAYHYGFNAGYNEAETVNYANSAWLDIGRVMSRVKTTHKTSNIVSLPVEYILYREAEALVAKYDAVGTDGMSESEGEDARNTRRTLSTYLSMCSKRLHHRNVSMRMSNVMLEDSSFEAMRGPGSERNIVCRDCSHPCFLFAEVCGTCMSLTHALCIKHSSTSKDDICIVPEHKPVLIQRFAMEYLNEMVGKLDTIGKSKASDEGVEMSELLNVLPTVQRSQEAQKSRNLKRRLRSKRNKGLK